MKILEELGIKMVIEGADKVRLKTLEDFAKEGIYPDEDGEINTDANYISKEYFEEFGGKTLKELLGNDPLLISYDEESIDDLKGEPVGADCFIVEK